MSRLPPLDTETPQDERTEKELLGAVLEGLECLEARLEALERRLTIETRKRNNEKAKNEKAKNGRLHV